MNDRLSRRAALGLLGVGTAAGVGTLAACDPAVSAAGSPAASAVAAWLSSRGRKYYIAHRGSGDVLPEHSMEAYRAAVAWGAKCLEISVAMTSDGVLICMHDLTYDRTTTTTGKISSLPSTVLRSVHLRQPQLGPAWALGPPRVPLFEDVLVAFGGRVVLAVEAKDDAAYPAMIALVEAYGLKDSVIVKAYYTTSRIAQAKAAGYPVFGYLGTEADVTSPNIAALAGKLKPATDSLVIPAYGSSGFLADSLVKQAVATGVPVWVFPVHRRSDAAHFFALGVSGIVTASFGYVSTSKPIATADTWKYGAVAPGEMTRSPDSPFYEPQWSEAGELTLAAKSQEHFITLGQFGPLAAAGGSYAVQLQAKWSVMPTDASSSVVLVFGTTDDSYFDLRQSQGQGYHLILRASGQLALFRHDRRSAAGTQLAQIQTAAVQPGVWFTLSVQVTSTSITATRTDVVGASVSTSDRTVRGGYLHIGRDSADGVATFRSLSVT